MRLCLVEYARLLSRDVSGCRSLEETVEGLRREEAALQAQLMAARATTFSLEDQLRDSREALGQSESATVAAEERAAAAVAALEAEAAVLADTQAQLQTAHRERVAAAAQLLGVQRESSERVRVFEDRAAAAREASLALERQRDSSLQEVARLCGEAEGMRGEMQRLCDELASAPAASTETIERLNAEIVDLRAQLAVQADESTLGKAQARVRALEEAVRAAEREQRLLRNTIAELRGNVRVFARVRPHLPGDGEEGGDMGPLAASEESGAVRLRFRGDKEEDQVFAFDKAYGPSATQEGVFADVSEFVQSALDGYNVCLLSYGQTGSGED